jgi:pimeloyl-ACP methyl ester carboxylesterase
VPRLAAVHFETSGHGYPLILGYPITASEVPEDPGGAVKKGYLDRLTDRYRVVVMDYPNIGKSKPIPATDLTADRVCADLLRVADAAGFDRFAWWGYSWGGVIGLQLACRTNRLTAFVCGGWPPLGNLYPKVLQSCRATVGTLEFQKQYVTFYESIRDWPEAESLKRITCPRLAYAGSEDVIERGGVKVETTAMLRAHRQELVNRGWQVSEIAGRDHSVWTDPSVVVPIVRPFLNRALGKRLAGAT